MSLGPLPSFLRTLELEGIHNHQPFEKTGNKELGDVESNFCGGGGVGVHVVSPFQWTQSSTRIDDVNTITKEFTNGIT